MGLGLLKKMQDKAASKVNERRAVQNERQVNQQLSNEERRRSRSTAYQKESARLAKAEGEAEGKRQAQADNLRAQKQARRGTGIHAAVYDLGLAGESMGKAGFGSGHGSHPFSFDAQFGPHKTATKPKPQTQNIKATVDGTTIIIKRPVQQEQKKERERHPLEWF